jgi:hypothetical protein
MRTPPIPIPLASHSTSKVFVKSSNTSKGASDNHPMGRFFFEKFFKWVAYQKIKIKDGIDMEV